MKPARWSELSREARAFRVVHAAVAGVGLSSVGYVWTCALTGRRDPALAAALAALSLQGIAIVAGRGHCPLGPLQRRLGDPTPFFQLVLPRRAARAAFPVLLPLSLTGVVVLAVRERRSAPRRRAR